MRKQLILALIIGLAWSTQLHAQYYKNEFSVSNDNDAYLWYGQDRYYTNGLFVNFRHALPERSADKRVRKYLLEWSAGQKMYNPQSGYSPFIFWQDRPFAAYLFGGTAVSMFTSKESVWKFGVELGTIGPKALGEEAQTLLHHIIGFYEIKGWEYQIGNDFTANAQINFSKLIHRSSDNQTDFSLDSYGKIGTTFSGAGLGIIFRAGRINPLFSSALNNSRIQNSKKKSNETLAKELYFYAKPQLNYVAYDATVQGSLFKHNSPLTFDVKPVVFSQTLGFNYSSAHFSIDYSMIFKTKEIKSDAKAHQYGNISLFYRFN
jgi:hypothetical protein